MLLQIILFALIPAAAIFTGGLVSSFYPPSKQTISFVQHFAAGVVFAALAGEVLPDLMSKHPSPGLVAAGFAFGVFLMMLIRWAVERKVKPGKADDPTTLIIVVGIDVLIDGLLIGAGLVLSETNKVGVLLAIALGLEILFLGLATGAEMIEAGNSRKQIISTVAILAVPPIVGVTLGATLLAGVQPYVMILILAFAAAALLYLVTEELLVEAHEVPETPFATASFFVGFLVLYIMEMLL